MPTTTIFSNSDVAFSHGAPGRADRRDPVSHPLSRGADRRHRPSDRPADRQYPHVNLHRDRPHRVRRSPHWAASSNRFCTIWTSTTRRRSPSIFSPKNSTSASIILRGNSKKSTAPRSYAMCWQKKITHAKELLRYSNSSIEEIARLCGMDDASYFNKVFKKMEGCTASEYRKQW